ncbi:hypothetical protein [Maribacter spongiicola]|uniref:hypothetical protein n=1 Tax=Maribacter spongiicola TaxID=1206753 RepID=UPI003F9B4FF4
MSNKPVLLFTLIFILAITKTYAGWYKCYTYKGTIGKSPITLSIQVTEGYFGIKDKQGFNVNGVYKYDKYNNPIKLEGILKNNNIQLYEIYDDKKSAILEFNISEDSVIGTWRSLQNQKTIPLKLKYISKLIDTSDDNVFENIEILQINTLKDYYFVGIYSKNKNEERARMLTLEIFNKRDNSLFQVLDFSDLDFGVGNVITIIYQNIEANSSTNNKLDIWCDVGRMGGWFSLYYDDHKRQFIPNYELNLDGE